MNYKNIFTGMSLWGVINVLRARGRQQCRFQSKPANSYVIMPFLTLTFASVNFILNCIPTLACIYSRNFTKRTVMQMVCGKLKILSIVDNVLFSCLEFVLYFVETRCSGLCPHSYNNNDNKLISLCMLYQNHWILCHFYVTDWTAMFAMTNF